MEHQVTHTRQSKADGIRDDRSLARGILAARMSTGSPSRLVEIAYINGEGPRSRKADRLIVRKSL